jgi:polar amino acid transport system substrate-binding protein
MKLMSIGALCALLAGSAAALAGETLDRVTGSGTLTVATNASWPPQSFLDENNNLAGFDIDVSNEIARRLGVSVTFDTPDWAVMTGGRWGGRWDVAVGSITPTKPRSEVLDFAGIYYYSPYVFAVHSDSPVTDLKELNGKRIGVETGTTSEDYMMRRLEIDAPDTPPIDYWLDAGEIKTYGSSMLPFDDLRLGDGVRLDAVIAPEQTVMGVIKSGYPVKALDGAFAFREPLVVVADKGDPEWTAKLAEIISEMRADGTLTALTSKWYGKDYSN